ncbi:unnamed protein product [Adineta ricciae]|nr:unnamed protein product [Adineta ricciae]
MTFNIQFYRTSRSTNPIAKFILAHHPDVVCLQENIDANGWSSSKLTPLDLTSDYTFAAECQAEKFHGHYLANTIYVLRKHMKYVEKLSAVNLTILTETVRCAAVLRLYGTVIANVHLCGGRFDDKQFWNFKELKYLQLKRLVQQYHPDIILGDFNNEQSKSVAKKQLDIYEFYKNLNSSDRLLFEHYYTAGSVYLQDQTKYSPAYNEATIGATSIYGGTPDWVYVTYPSRLTGKVGKYDTITTNLSDHNALFIEYLFDKIN